MALFVANLELCNFLSFFGVQKVDLQPFTSITCNYYQGREDLCRAIAFVFGATFDEMLVQTPNDLIHTSVRSRNCKGNSAPSYVQVIVNEIRRKVKLYVGIENDLVVHKIDDVPVSALSYDRILSEMNINFKHKNIIVHRHYFFDVMWGTSEDVEIVLTKILRGNEIINTLNETNRRIKNLEETQCLFYEKKKILELEKYHDTLEKFVDARDIVAINRDQPNDTATEEIEYRRDVTLPSATDITSELENSTSATIAEEEETALNERFRALQTNEYTSLSLLYYCEEKLAVKSEDYSILLKRITNLKNYLKECESHLSSLFSELQGLNIQLDKLKCKISIDMAVLTDLQISYFRQNRLTKYGRLMDYLRPGTFAVLLKQILGVHILYGNLCDDLETAASFCGHLRDMKYEGRETFIVLNEYSTQFKDLLISSGKNGIIITSIKDLQIFLCKLKRYGLINAVPIITSRKFNFLLEEGTSHQDGVLYVDSGVFLHKDGTISYEFDTETNIHAEEVVMQRVKSLLIQEELKYQDLCDLYLRKWETLLRIWSTENDIQNLTLKCKKKQLAFEVPECQYVSEDYSEYSNIFKEFNLNIKKIQEDLEASEFMLPDSEWTDSTNLAPEMIPEPSSIYQNIQATRNEMEEVKVELENVKRKIKLSNTTSDKVLCLPYKKFVFLENSRVEGNIFHNEQVKKLSMIMTVDDINEFVYSKVWRRTTIKMFIENLASRRNQFKRKKRILNDLTASRNKYLSPVMEHCSLHLTPTFRLMIETPLPFLGLIMTPNENGVQLLTSLTERPGNLLEINNFNTLLKCTAALALFLQVAAYSKVPVLIIDDIEEFLPRKKHGITPAWSDLNKISTSPENSSFQALMRIGQYLNYFIHKNTSTTSIPNKTTSFNGPIQLLYFTSGDLVHCGKGQIWIRRMSLPDEFITKENDSYSAMEEIKYSFMS